MTHFLYQKLKQYAIDHNLTAGDVVNASKQQVANILGKDVNAPFWSGGNEGFYVNLKANLVQELEQRGDAAYRQALIAKVDTFLKEKFPNYEMEITRHDGRKITIWLDGKTHPELIEV